MDGGAGGDDSAGATGPAGASGAGGSASGGGAAGLGGAPGTSGGADGAAGSTTGVGGSAPSAGSGSGNGGSGAQGASSSGGSAGDSSIEDPTPLPEYCSSDGWCGALLEFSDIWGFGADDVWVVARSHDVEARHGVLHFDGREWSTLVADDEASPYDFGGLNLSAVWGTSSEDLWAVGNAGGVIHTDGVSWTLAAPVTEADLYDVHGVDSKDVWAVGKGGATLHWDGTAWSELSTTLTSDLAAVFASESGVWAAGSERTIARWNGTDWQPEEMPAAVAPPDARFTAIWATSSDDLWVVGYPRVVLHRRADQWTRYELPSSNDALELTDVRGEGSRIWASASDGRVYAFDGVSWETPRIELDQPLNALFPASNGELWAVGARASSLHFDGRVGATRSPATGADLTAIWAAAPDDVWAGAIDGTLVHFDGRRWSWRAKPTAERITVIWGTSATDIWAADGDQGIFHYDGRNWSVPRSTPFGTVVSFWGSSANDVWAVGSFRNDGPQARAWHFNGLSWQVVGEIPDAAAVEGVWGTDSEHVWILTDRSKILSFVGDTWTSIVEPTCPAPSCAPFGRFLFGSGSDDGWAFSTLVLLESTPTEYSIYYSHFDGTWSPFTLGWDDPASLVSGWSRARNDVYLVRSFASHERDIVHFDGGSPVGEYSGAWRTVFSFERVLALGGAPSGDVWAVGSLGATIRKHR